MRAVSTVLETASWIFEASLNLEMISPVLRVLKKSIGRRITCLK